MTDRTDDWIEAAPASDPAGQLSFGDSTFPLPPEAKAEAEPLPAPALPDRPPAPGTVITAVIDDGLPIAHFRFRSGPTDTRIAWAWVQDGPGRAPSHVAYGREFTKPDIDRLLTQCLVAGQVEEDDFYRRAGITDYGVRPGRTALGRAATHGANVMDQAAGHGRDDTDRPTSNPIIAVQLPGAAVADTSGMQFEKFAADALDYIFDRADRIAEALGCGPLPLVVNFSFGFIAGPHDGSHPLERKMDSMLTARRAQAPTEITLPAGNSRQARCHARIHGSADHRRMTPDAVTWRVLPDDRTPSFAVFYMPESASAPAASRVRLRLVTPTGVEGPWLGEIPGMGWEWRPGGGDALAKISYLYIGGTTGRGRFVCALRPTRQLDRDHPVAPAGAWRIETQNVALGENDRIAAYVQRDDTPFGHPERGRQSYFDDPAYRRYTVNGIPVDADDPAAHVRRDGTLNALATGQSTIVLGGYERIFGQPALYSAAGPGVASGGTPARIGPDAMGPSDDTRVHRGMIGAGTRSGASFALSGTSVAAPQLARRIARAMADGTWPPPGGLADWVSSPIPAGWPQPLQATRAGAGRIATRPIVPVPR